MNPPDAGAEDGAPAAESAEDLWAEACGLCDDKRDAEAERVLTRLIALDPDDPDAFALRGDCRTRRGGREAVRLAEADHVEALRLDPRHLQAATGLATLLCRRRRDAQAALLLDGLSDPDALDEDTDPTDLALALAWRAEARHRLGDHAGAEADLGVALTLQFDRGSLLGQRARVRRSLGRLEDARADLTAALEFEPEDVWALTTRAAIAAELGDAAAARADLDRAIALAPDDANPLADRAALHAAAGDFEAARDDYAAALRLDPGHAGARTGLDRLSSPGDSADSSPAALHPGASAMFHVPGPSGVLVPSLLRAHFRPHDPAELEVVERRFPVPLRADLQRALDALTGAEQPDVKDGAAWRVERFCGVKTRYHGDGVSFGQLTDGDDPARTAPPQFEQIDVGEEEPVRCVASGLWLLSRDGVEGEQDGEREADRNDAGGDRLALLIEPASRHSRCEGLRVQAAAPATPAGRAAAEALLRDVGERVRRGGCYRGKVLSLEVADRYEGLAGGVTVHALPAVEREQVILPAATLDLLDRNVLRFAADRPRLRAAGLPTKKGLLFYGPPGTGKTHTVRYLASALPGCTTLLVTAEQVGLLAQYISLARLLVPSLVVIEDADLIARDRESIGDACGESLLNKLLNEMDGLKPDADVLFVLTTNRPAALEGALAGRPGRIDQAVEFPPPDREGREKLVRLYARGAKVGDGTVADAAARTEDVSAAFLRELMRRSAQFAVERSGPAVDDSKGSSLEITTPDVAAALEELLVSGGSLNRALLGAGDAVV